MKIELEISPETITNMMISAIESGDPVTTASKGGWCMGIFWETRAASPPKGIWYADTAFWDGDFKVEILEVADEDAYDRDEDEDANIASGALKLHTVRKAQFRSGLAVMAEKFPHQFGQVISGDTDAPCADAFLQSVLFGDEKYA
jgi:hypothetical protein